MSDDERRGTRGCDAARVPRRVARWVVGFALAIALTGLSTGLDPVSPAQGRAHERGGEGAVPAGARYQCKDGTYSSVRHGSSACAGHNGVLRSL